MINYAGRQAVIYFSVYLLAWMGCGCASRPAGRLPSAAPAPEPAAPASVPGAQTSWHESFDNPNLKGWREIQIKRRCAYRAMNLEGRLCLEALSHSSASILVHKILVDSAATPWLGWQWRVDRFVDGEALGRKEGSDASARVYVYFDTPGLPWQKRNIDYVWSANLPVGTVLESPYSALSKIVVAASGVEDKGRWRQEERNLYEDYYRCYHAAPPPVVAIGLMTDTDSAGGYGLAYYDDLMISRQPQLSREQAAAGMKK